MSGPVGGASLGQGERQCQKYIARVHQEGMIMVFNPKIVKLHAFEALLGLYRHYTKRRVEGR